MSYRKKDFTLRAEPQERIFTVKQRKLKKEQITDKLQFPDNTDKAKMTVPVDNSGMGDDASLRLQPVESGFTP